MICPNCGGNVSDKRTRCDKCGTDLQIYTRINRTANYYYNDGLAKAKVHDLSGAIVALRKCLELNKAHTNARNLLGLTYFALGETVAALSEWVISRHFQPKNNDADGYIHRVQANPTRLETLNQAIKRYNSALTFSKQGSEDLAIIQLKKVVSLNPNFVRAYQLLALLHLKTGEAEKARKYLIKAGKIDVSNTTTLRYMREFDNSMNKDPDANPESDEPSYTKSIMPISSYREDKPNVMAYVNLVIGVLIGLAFMAFLVLRDVKDDDKETDQKANTNYTVMLQSKNDEIKKLTDSNKELQGQIAELNKQLTESADPEEIATIYNDLLSVTMQYTTEMEKPKSSREYEVIADALYNIDQTKFSNEAAVALLTDMRAKVYPEVAGDYYQQAHVQYKAKKYNDALPLFTKAMEFDPLDDDAVYFVARCYEFIKDKTNAALYYNKVITDFPQSSRVKSATSNLNRVQGQ